MNRKFVVAVDLEGLACVVGAYGRGLAESRDYEFAALQGTRGGFRCGERTFR